MEEQIDNIEPTRMQFLYENASHIFTELAGEVRQEMLVKLNKRSLRLGELAKDLGITNQHAHSNINRLIDAGLVIKTHDGSFRLTTYGKTVINQLSTFYFLAEHKEYLQDHTLGNLPIKFQRRIGDLQQCEVVEGVGNVIQRWELMYQGAGKYIESITTQVLLHLIDPLAEKVKSGTSLSYIMPEKMKVPIGTKERTRKLSWDELVRSGKAQRRMVKNVLVATIITDRSAGVLFPGLKNEVDMNVMFCSKDQDPAFREWCQDYFSYMWDSAYPFDRTKLQET